MNELVIMGERAKQAAKQLASVLSSQKDSFLLALADTLEAKSQIIIKENAKDLENAKQNGMSISIQDRLLLNEERISQMASSVRYIAGLPDPINRVISGTTRPNGLGIIQKTVPLGVIGMIYESRPNVTIDSAILCLKSGNACILRGGSEAINSNIALADIINQTLEEQKLPIYAVQLVADTDRKTAEALMKLQGYVDILIPRGGKGLIQTVIKTATVPVIETGAGLCHTYVDSSASVSMAVEIIRNAKTSRPSVCNALETLLVHEDIAESLLPMVKASTINKGVELRGCEKTLNILTEITPATEEDWSTEYDDLILSIKIVSSLNEAMEHIDKYSTHHSECIVTESFENAQIFTSTVDSAAVYVNASTRFTDGGEFGLGAEIGISTQKLHVRGPMGLDALTSTKYIVTGNGQIR